MFSIHNLRQAFFHFLFFVLFIAALFLYKERLYMQTSLSVFKVLNNGFFYLPMGNASLLLSQVLPLMFYYLGGSLKFLLILFSISHIIFFYLIFLILYYKLKDEAAAMVLLLFLFVAQIWSFYTPMEEINYGMAFILLFYSLLRKRLYYKTIHYAALVVLAFFILSGSFFNFLLFLFVVVWDMMDRGFSLKPHAPLLGMVPLFMLIKLVKISSNKVEDSISISENIGMQGVQHFIEVSLLYFPEITLAFLVLLFWLNKHKKGSKNLFLILSYLILMLSFIIGIGSSTTLWQIEMNYKAVLIMVFIVFFYEVYQSVNAKAKNLIFLLFALVIIARGSLSWIYGESRRESSDQLERIIYTSLNQNGNKFLINEENIKSGYSGILTSTSVETLLLSSIKGKENSLSIALDSMFYGNLKNEKQKKEKLYIANEGFVADSLLNERFFNVSSSEYHHLNSAQFTYPKEYLKDSVKIEILNKKNIFPRNSTQLFLCRISNFSKNPLPSNVHSNIRISYHIYNTEEVVEWDGIRTPIELDVSTYHDQYFKVELPDKTGTYYIQPDIVIEGELWVGNQEKYEINVF